MINQGWRTAIILLLGILIGLAGGAWGFRYFYTHNWVKKDPSHFFLNRLDRHLKLTADQRAKAEAILAAKKKQMDSLGEEARPKFEKIRKEGEKEIRALLNPDQAASFDQILKKSKNAAREDPGAAGSAAVRPPTTLQVRRRAAEKRLSVIGCLFTTNNQRRITNSNL